MHIQQYTGNELFWEIVTRVGNRHENKLQWNFHKLSVCKKKK